MPPESAVGTLGLSQRETQVLTLAQQGLTDKQIAVKTELSVETVRTYWQRIRRKVGGVTRSEIVALWLRERQQVTLRAHEEETEALRSDLQKREAVLAKIRRSEHLFRTVCDSSANGLVVCDAKGNVVYRNRRMTELTGYTEDENRGRPWLDCIDPIERTEMLQQLARWESGMPALRFECQLKTKHGEIRQLVTWSTPMLEEGTLVGFVVTVDDVTDDRALARERERLLAVQEAHRLQLQRIAELAPDVIYLVDIEKMQNVYSNRSIAEVLGYSPEEVAAWEPAQFLQLFHPDDRDVVFGHRERMRTLEIGQFASINFRARRKDGTYTWMVSRESPYEKDANGLTRITLGFASLLSEPTS